MNEEEKRQVMILIAGASAALKFQEKNPRAQDSEIFQHITTNAKEIINNVDDPL
jgi:hypothetical protein